VSDPSLIVDFGPLQLIEDLSFEGKPVSILVFETKTLRNREISLVKFQWRSQSSEEAARERGGRDVIAVS